MLATITNRENKKNKHKFTFERCLTQGLKGTTMKFYCVVDYYNYGEERDVKIMDSIDVWINSTKWKIEIDGDIDGKRFAYELEKNNYSTK